MRDKPCQKISRLREQQLVQSLRAGDRSAAVELIEAHRQRLFSFVWRVVSNHQEAEDICQDAFLKAISSIDSFDPTYRFSTWLFTIAYRLCLNGWRRKHRCVDADLDFSTFASAEVTPEVAVESEEAAHLKAQVWGAVERLSQPQRAAITLFYRENLSCQEIAEMMAVPVATVKSHLHRARGKLKELLAPVFGSDLQKLSILNAAVA